jgi:ribosome silencing factor RsfS/YbeB/iojap
MFSSEETKVVKSSLANADADTIAKAIVEELDEMKAQDIKIMTVSDKTVVTDYLIICTGNSSTQIKSISGRLEMKLKERELEPLNIDGYAEGTCHPGYPSEACRHHLQNRCRLPGFPQSPAEQSGWLCLHPAPL